MVIDNVEKRDSTETAINNYKCRIEKIKNGGQFSRLGRAFSTTANNYFYDTGTGKVFQIEDNTYKVLRCLSVTNDFDKLFELPMTSSEVLSALETIEEAIKSENILLAPPVKGMEGPQVHQLKERSQKTTLMTLEVTERCNLRCKYCVYNDHGAYRAFGNKDMSFETAKKAIDYFSEHSDKELYLSFYGGEPLLKFGLIKQCISYAKSVISKKKKLRFSLTTNATLLTPEIAKYFASIDDFVITVSLDGPENIHNENRVYSNGNGSYNDTIKGLKNLIKATGKNARNLIKINMVSEYPSIEKFNQIQDFIDSTSWLPKGIMITTNYATHGEIESEPILPDSQMELSMFNKLEIEFDPLSYWSKHRMKDNNISLSENTLISNDSITKELSTIHRRMLTDLPMQIYFMNGCCIPGARRLYVTTDGNFKLCEKIGPAPYLGNVEEGLDLEEVQKHYVTDFIDEAVKYCSQCWAVNICPLCYTECYDEKGVHFSYRHVHCMGNRQLLEQSLIKYHEILETNPEELAYLNSIQYK